MSREEERGAGAERGGLEKVLEETGTEKVVITTVEGQDLGLGHVTDTTIIIIAKGDMKGTAPSLERGNIREDVPDLETDTSNVVLVLYCLSVVKGRHD